MWSSNNTAVYWKLEDLSLGPFYYLDLGKVNLPEPPLSHLSNGAILSTRCAVNEGSLS